MGLSLTPITHVSASPLFDPGRSVFPSPVLTLASKSLGRLPIVSEAQVLTHVHPYPQWFTPESVSMQVLRPSMSGTSETAKCPEPLRLSKVLPLRGWSSLHLERHCPSLFATTDSSASPNPSPCLWTSPRSVGLCRLLSVPAGSRTFPTLSLRFFLYVPGPLPRLLLECIRPFLPPRHWPSPRWDRVGASLLSVLTTFRARAPISRLQSFASLQARRFACHSGRPHRASHYPHSGCGFSIRTTLGSLPPQAPDMLVVQTGQLTTGDFHPIRFAALSAVPPTARS